MKKCVFLLALVSLVWSCKETNVPLEPEPPKELELSSDVLVKWSELSLSVIKNSIENSPTYASRSVGYLGLAAYESVAPGSIIFQSVNSQLNEFPAMPVKNDTLKYDWEISANEAQKLVLNYLYPHAKIVDQKRIDSLHSSILEEKSALIMEPKTILNSIEFGQKVAEKIIERALEDGGHDGWTRTFDARFPINRGLGYWTPPIRGQSSIPLPMHPHWGNNKTFLKENASLAIPTMVPFSNSRESIYFQQMEEVLEIQTNLTQEQKEMAIWWGDDPSSTVSPPGHSYYLAIKLAKEKGLNLFETASLLSKVGMSVADAFINCWKCKYFYQSERPTIFILRYLRSGYEQFWPEPPFPGFTSGHSTQIAAAAVAMASVFGNETAFEDDLHQNKPMDMERNVEYKNRRFTSFWEMAEECGISRLYGGIHTRQDNEMGLDEGKKIGENVSGLKWKVDSL